MLLQLASSKKCTVVKVQVWRRYLGNLGEHKKIALLHYPTTDHGPSTTSHDCLCHSSVVSRQLSIRPTSYRKFVLGSTVLLWLFAGLAQAHKVSLFAYLEGDVVHTESYFADGSKCSHSKILVYGPDETLLLEGKADAEGIFSFKHPGPEPLRIVVEASMGHRSEYRLRKEIEMGAADVAAPPIPEAQSTVGSIPADLEQMLERKLAPLVANIERMRHEQERARLQDILGGIGYIIGLLGIVMYLRTRGKRA